MYMCIITILYYIILYYIKPYVIYTVYAYVCM